MNILSPEIVLTTFLIFVRVASIIATAPFFGSDIFFQRIKLFFALLVTIVLLPAIPLAGAVIPVDIKLLELAILILKEVLVGVGLGLVGQIVFGGVQFGGQFVSIQVGLGFANIIDPQTQTQNPIFSQLFLLFGVILFLGIGGEITYIRALAHSFNTIPIGTINAAGPGPEFMEMASQIFIIGVQLASPFIVTLFLLDLAFAIFARIMPQANIFFIALPLKVGGGIIILWLIVPKLSVAFNTYFQTLFNYLAIIMERMAG